MALMEWSEGLVTGDAVIDSQHRTLFKMINELHEAILTKRSKEVTSAIIDALERYVGYHFNVERQLMEASGYPAARVHMKLHEDIVTRTRQTIQSYRTNGLAMGITFTQVLARTLVEHILGEDKQLVQWSRLNGVQPAASGLFPSHPVAKPAGSAEPSGADRTSTTVKATSSGNWAARDSLRLLVAAKAARNNK